ncbi:MAG: S-methyl-5'-thioadenosine phosphorylase [Nanoarchaeota archaeon]|nr:S-methyl-5'-thioadenosine phosphorylase [Nanoarchaeota archaeon]
MAIGIIGGTGVYDAKLLSEVKQLKISTPYGMTSDLLTVGKLAGKEIVVIPRHGANHFFSPSKVPFKANIWAMKELGVTKIISVNAVGSLKEELKPGHFVFTSQFIDRTTKRDQTFNETGKIGHVSVADPFCNNLREVLIKKAKELDYDFHYQGTCIVIEGPRFSTRAESVLFKSWGADTVNMTLVPEVVLAREAEICYANIAMVTDYDAWKDHAVTNTDVLSVMKGNIEKVRKLLMEVIPLVDDKKACACNHAMKDAWM